MPNDTTAAPRRRKPASQRGSAARTTRRAPAASMLMLRSNSSARRTTGDRSAGSNAANRSAIDASLHVPAAQRASTRPVGSVTSIKPDCCCSDSSASRSRTSAGAWSNASRRIKSSPSAAAAVARSRTSCKSRPRATCKARWASASIPCSTLENTNAMETAATAMTGTSVAAIRNTDRRHRRPCLRRNPGRPGSAGGVNRSSPDSR